MRRMWTDCTYRFPNCLQNLFKQCDIVGVPGQRIPERSEYFWETFIMGARDFQIEDFFDFLVEIFNEKCVFPDAHVTEVLPLKLRKWDGLESIPIINVNEEWKAIIRTLTVLDVNSPVCISPRYGVSLTNFWPLSSLLWGPLFNGAGHCVVHHAPFLGHHQLLHQIPLQMSCRCRKS